MGSKTAVLMIAAGAAWAWWATPNPVLASADDVVVGRRTIIDVANPEMVRRRRPLLIAHRGGVVTSKSPECSPAAIRLAAEAGYDMVELDVRPSSDHVPIVFHDENLNRACGVDRDVADMTAREIAQVRYRASDEPVSQLDEALALCKSLSLGVMLDFKVADVACLEQTARLVSRHRLERSTVTINGDPVIQRRLQQASLVRLTTWEKASTAPLAKGSLAGRFWF
jgi:glycerophosphoryl diester phosphodiesterase